MPKNMGKRVGTFSLQEDPMGKILSSSRYLAIIAVLALLVSALAGFGWGIIKTVDAVALIITSLGEDAGIIIALIEIVDAFLVATAVLIFAFGLYELFIAELKLPDWIQIHTLHDLKAKLGGVLVLVMAVKFLEKLAEWKNAQETLFFALAIAVISATLIAFSALGGKD
jgi:uncharacterized membrane protein YqhA